MGLYNTIVGSPDEHPLLGEHDGIQFKWGECRLYEYRVGDRITWADDRPAGADGILQLSGIGGRDRPFSYFAVTIEDDVIQGFSEISEEEYRSLERSEPRTIHRAV